MTKNTLKIIGLFILLTFSFIYTEKLFNISRNSDPLMKHIIEYKNKNDFKPVNGIVNNNKTDRKIYCSKSLCLGMEILHNSN